MSMYVSRNNAFSTRESEESEVCKITEESFPHNKGIFNRSCWLPSMSVAVIGSLNALIICSRLEAKLILCSCVADLFTVVLHVHEESKNLQQGTFLAAYLLQTHDL